MGWFWVESRSMHSPGGERDLLQIAVLSGPRRGLADLLVDGPEPSIHVAPASYTLSFCPTFVRPPVSVNTIRVDHKPAEIRENCFS
jgi:hypothetical protein